MAGDTKVVVCAAQNVSGGVQLPGDKSISHRYAMLAAIAEGKSKFENFSAAADCASTLGCLRSLGVAVNVNGSTVEIEGRGLRLAAPTQVLDCGNSGSTMRMLSGILAGQDFECTLIGDESLSRRPMARIMDPLRQMGASITGTQENRPPLIIRGGRLHSIEYQPKVASAQVKSCVLFAGLLAEGTTVVDEPIRTRDHGELALRAFGAEVVRTGNRSSVAGGQNLHGVEAFIPGDISSAAFFFCAALIFPHGNLVVDNVSLNPTRAALLDVLASMGARISFLRVEEQHGELIGTVRLQPPAAVRGTKISGPLAASLIDELPVLAAIAPYTEDGIEIRDAAELRVKESDRIATVLQNLRAMGAEVEEFPDGLRVRGKQKLHGAAIEPHGDHRIAMAFSVAALRAQGDTTIHDAGCVGVSYPAFFDMLTSLTAAQ